ncbi:hypothetical protein CAI21_13640 [Alkalilimnicola ehrlichii]|uniref:Glutathione synthase n=2 Tax=Alkalilimnicola ehrlichii TaxID=351052 RepID=A0A3E0WRK1_9GAMM|nr:hypothetical protein CAI21_13640 [Alkalilimnicola ehrlichii]RFA34605.1 hypothetical protein CAL65_14665 [Alkalilimnicola ehrlichii]
MEVLRKAWSQLLAKGEKDDSAAAALARLLALRMDGLDIDSASGLLPVLPVMLTAKQEFAIHQLVDELCTLIRRVAKDIMACPDGLSLLGIGDAQHENFMAPCASDRHAADILRADVILNCGKPYIIEVNFNSLLGGSSETPVLTGAYLDWCLRAEHGEGMGFTAANFFSARTHYLWSLLRRNPLKGRPVVAVIGLPSDIETYRSFFEREQHYLRSHGVLAILVPPEKVAVVDGWLVAGGHRLDIAIRQYQLGDAVRDELDFAHLRSLEQEARHTIFLTTQHCQLYSSKYILAELHARAPGLDAAERQLVYEHVPWTAVLREGRANQLGDAVDLLPFVLANREGLVIKPIDANMGRGVVVGRDVTAEQWRRVVEAAATEGRHVVQWFVESDLFPMLSCDPASGNLQESYVQSVFGPYQLGGRPGGINVRQRRVDDGCHMVNWDNDKIMNAALTAYPDVFAANGQEGVRESSARPSKAVHDFDY